MNNPNTRNGANHRNPPQQSDKQRSQSTDYTQIVYAGGGANLMRNRWGRIAQMEEVRTIRR